MQLTVRLVKTHAYGYKSIQWIRLQVKGHQRGLFMQKQGSIKVEQAQSLTEALGSALGGDIEACLWYLHEKVASPPPLRFPWGTLSRQGLTPG